MLRGAQALEDKATRIRKQIDIKPVGEAVWSAETLDGMLMVESNGDGNYTPSEVEGNYPADFLAIQSKQFTNRDAAERAT